MAPGLNTASVAVATTPTVISTFFAHLFARRSRKRASRKSLADGGPGGGPENQLTYEEGLRVVRRFIDYASTHGVEDVQAFTAMAIPTPRELLRPYIRHVHPNAPDTRRFQAKPSCVLKVHKAQHGDWISIGSFSSYDWVKRDVVTIPTDIIDRAAAILSEHLATYGSGDGIKLVGGEKWWQVRGRDLEGEWIEMQKDYLRRTAVVKQNGDVKLRASTDSHPETTGSAPAAPVEAIKHARLPKRTATLGSVRDNTGSEVIGERVILYIHGGAFFFSSLDTHRYQVQRHARKAGARAFSPAYRLSPQYPFPCGLLDSLAAYLYLIDPPAGRHRPILPTSIIFMGDSAGAGMAISLLVLIREMGLPMPAGASLISPWVDLTHSMPSISGWDGADFIPSTGFHYKPGPAWPPIPGDGVRIPLADGGEMVVDEQVQMYCPNTLLTHPLVSPVNQGSLGGLCPLLIMGGGGELLRDEITLLAYRAANPTTYPPASAVLTTYPEQRALVDKYPPTKVHLQIYEGGCHVVPTLSWTSTAKFMYRACANFNIWAFTAAAKALEGQVQATHHKRPSHRASRDATMDSARSDIAPVANGIHQSSVLTDEPTSTAASSNTGSAVDLTQPVITASAHREANADALEPTDLESEASSDSEDTDGAASAAEVPAIGIVTVRGHEPFSGPENIVSERVSTHGHIRPFEAVEAIPALQPSLREHIGQVHPDGAIQKWLAKRREWDAKYGKELAKWREIKVADRAKAEQEGFLTRDLQGERPPLAALAGWYDQSLAREAARSVDEITRKTSGAVRMWMKVSSKADEEHAGGDNLQEIKETVADQLRRESVSQGSAPPGPAA